MRSNHFKQKKIKDPIISYMLHNYNNLGYWHEQSRLDRSKYIVINWDNIQAGKKRNFHKCRSCTTQGHMYDVKSVMHYSKYAFSNGNGPTMRMKGCIKCELGQRKGFSKLDIKGINALYRCDK